MNDVDAAAGAHRENTRGEDFERELESDVERLRDELDAVVGELDRRRHRALQLRRHAGLVTAAGTVALLLAVVGIARWRSSRRRARCRI